MADISRFRALSPRERALVAIAVLIDGRDAIDFLSFDKERRTALVRAAEDLVDPNNEMRIPLTGTLLREALASLKEDEPL